MGHRADSPPGPGYDAVACRTAARHWEESAVNIDKEQVLQVLRDMGKHQEADQAQQELPDQVDTDQHAGLLSKYGIDPQELIGRLGGLGGLGQAL